MSLSWVVSIEQASVLCIVIVYVYVEAGEMAGWFHLDLLYLYNI